MPCSSLRDRVGEHDRLVSAKAGAGGTARIPCCSPHPPWLRRPASLVGGVPHSFVSGWFRDVRALEDALADDRG